MVTVKCHSPLLAFHSTSLKGNYNRREFKYCESLFALNLVFSVSKVSLARKNDCVTTGYKLKTFKMCAFAKCKLRWLVILLLFSYFFNQQWELALVSGAPMSSCEVSGQWKWFCLLSLTLGKFNKGEKNLQKWFWLKLGIML